MSALPPALADYLLALADDELILGHRNSEWCGHAPILEEDIAFANLAQDEMGHASLWYALVHAQTGRAPDHLVFFRAVDEYRSAQLVELPRGDWAFSMLRQYLFDAAEVVRLPGLAKSRHEPLAAAAAKIRTEEVYHYRHTHAWITRLGLGTAESHRRMQAALDELWAFALQLFVPLPGEGELVSQGFVPASGAVRSEWQALVQPALVAAGLVFPPAAEPAALSRAAHSPHLPALLDEMQSVARLEGPQVKW